MHKKITTFIIRLCSIGIVLAMSTLHATYVDTYSDEKDNSDGKDNIEQKLITLQKEVQIYDTLTKDDKDVLKQLLSDKPNRTVALDGNTIIPYKTLDVFKKAAAFDDQSDIWTRKGLSPLEIERISCLIMLQTEEAQNEFGEELLPYYEAIAKEDELIATCLKKMQIKAILAPLSTQEQALLEKLLAENFMNVDKLPHEAVALLRAVDNHMTLEAAHDFTSIHEYNATIGANKEALLLPLIEAQKFFTEKIEQLVLGKTKVVNSLLQLICLQGCNGDSALQAFISSHLESYALYSEQVKRIVDEKLCKSPTELGSLGRKKTSTDTALEIIKTFLAEKIAKKEYLQMKIAYFIALLTKCTGGEEALAEAIDTLQCAFKKRLECLYVTTDKPISTFFIDKVVNTLLCDLVDTNQVNNKQIKEMVSIQALRKAQFRFKLIETIKESLQNQPQIKQCLNKLNNSGEAIVIEETITEELAELLMALDKFMQNKTIEIGKKKKVITETLKSLKETISLACTARLNTIKQQGIEKKITELKAHIWSVFITSSIKTMQLGQQDISAIYTQVKHIKEWWPSLWHGQDKQAKIKQLLALIKEATQGNNPSPQASTTIEEAVYDPTANDYDLSNPVEWRKWFSKLQHTIRTQAANVWPLLAFLVIILLNYYKQLQPTG